ncbi:putative Histidine kinase [Candidatus Sulfobium mesophilum]|uniref:histidine kinase n=1 Tax=Candidatus Sulfobium mesophilum TaxID=2016548 RepID=A0A2U3QFW8_9BACT|nr:putative Histidine kinase [Candidatus Sulfobium mesophilum]
MFKGWLLFTFILGYLSLLFLIAYYADRREKTGRSIVSNPYVYALSMAVYCTSWTFYGSVGKAATSGLSFLTIYLGPTLMASLWLVILRKIIIIAKENRITTIADFIGSRYGNSILLSALVAIVAVVGITPYLGLQIKAIIKTFTILAGETKGSAEAGWFITLILGIFAIIFGARRLDSSERHEGLIFAIAFESIVKLLAFLVVGVFVTYGMFGGFSDIFARIQDSEYSELLYLGSAVSYKEWGSLLFLSMMAIMFLPRQFHVAVVENSDVSHVSKAMWLFPLYLFLINIFVIPVAFGGLLLGGGQADADNFVLTIPLGQNAYPVALIAFIGGFSAATGMVIVESLALSTMVMNNLVMPAIYRFNEMRGFPAIILNLKRVIILVCVFLGYFFAVSIGEFYSLVDIGLKSFEAVTIFAPAIILGLFWKRGNKNGATIGIIAGFAVWFYTLLMPALLKSGMLTEKGFFGYLLHSEILNPHALFGVEGFDKWSHSLFWGLFFNLAFYIGFSIFTRQTEEEQKQSLLFVESYSPKMLPSKGNYSIQQITDVLGQYVGRRESREIVEQFIARNSIRRESISRQELIRLKDEAERVLSGALGSAIATIIFEDKLTLTESERGELSTSIKQITETLRLSRQELAEANRNLAYLKEFSENIIESAPLGIVTIDSALLVRYWNKEIVNMTGIKKGEAFNRPINKLMPWVPGEVFLHSEQGEMTVQNPAMQTLKINISPLKDPSGGFVVILEDITEKKKMEEQLFQASKLASIGKLTAGISHEIGNPLASISSLVQEIRSLRGETFSQVPYRDGETPVSENNHGNGDGEDSLFLEESLRTINNHIERIAKIVRSLGDFARTSSREKIKSNVSEILDRTVNLVRYDKRFKNVRLVSNIEPIPELMINADRMQQVFLNLMLNAIDAMPSGGTLTVSMKRRGDSVEIVFSDTGVGIDEVIIDRIFDPFFTTKPFGKGTGLGLSMCYGIIREHNGTISVKSKKGEGTTFTINLPVEE